MRLYFQINHLVSLVGSNQLNFFENANTCSKHTLKTTVATQLNLLLGCFFIYSLVHLALAAKWAAVISFQ